MKRLACACVVLLAGVATADDKKPEPKGEEVSGKVLLNGAPLKAGSVTFASKDGKTTVATPIAEDGTYLARVPQGEYTVAIGPPKVKDPKNPPPAIPAKYSDPKTSGITYTVTAGKQTFDLDLKSR
jgi:hypothetical protein